jgi:hypothetical protein
MKGKYNTSKSLEHLQYCKKTLQGYKRRICISKIVCTKDHTNNFQYQHYIHTRLRIRVFLKTSITFGSFNFLPQELIKS